MRLFRNVLGIVLFSALVLSSCYPDKIDYVDEYDLAATMYDESVDFSSYTTFTVLDTIVHLTDDDQDDPNFSREMDDFILDLLRENMRLAGYTEIASPDSVNKPDLILFTQALSSDYYQYWGYWWGYYDYYPGWSWWYPGYPGYPGYPWYPWYPGGGYVTSYTTGTLIVEMVDSDTYDPDENTIDVVWDGYVDGLLTNSVSGARIEKQINQLFIQSPYLKN